MLWALRIAVNRPMASQVLLSQSVLESTIVEVALRDGFLIDLLTRSWTVILKVELHSIRTCSTARHVEDVLIV